MREFRNIENRDAVLAWARVETERHEDGAPVTRWDGRTFKIHPVTGEPVPDETARVAVERYIGPRKAQWPEADFVVGNPPFIGTARMRAALGDGMVTRKRYVVYVYPLNCEKTLGYGNEYSILHHISWRSL